MNSLVQSLFKKISGRIQRVMFRPSRRTIAVAGVGVEIAVDDLFASAVYKESRHWPELDWVAANVPDSPGLVLDVGANQGVTSIFYARTFPSALVLAVEPHPFNAAQILRNARANLVRNLAVLPCAVAERPGEVFISDHSNSSVVARDGISVPAVRLDDLRSGPVRFLKIDVEGLELEVLRGAEHLIGADRPVMDVEIHLFFRENPLAFLRSVVAWLSAFDYRFDAVAGYQGGLVENAGEADWERLSREKVLNLLCRPR
jgi:FkbM family methyltransferase